MAVCLIDNYLASRFCVKEEVPYLLERRQRDRVRLIPVLLEPCLWDQLPWIEQRQMFLRDGKSVTVDFKGREKRVFAEIAKSVLRKLDTADWPHSNFHRFVHLGPILRNGRPRRLGNGVWNDGAIRATQPCLTGLK